MCGLGARATLGFLSGPWPPRTSRRCVWILSPAQLRVPGNLHAPYLHVHCMEKTCPYCKSPTRLSLVFFDIFNDFMINCLNLAPFLFLF